MIIELTDDVFEKTSLNESSRTVLLTETNGGIKHDNVDEVVTTVSIKTELCNMH
jgi:hypothetical protein